MTCYQRSCSTCPVGTLAIPQQGQCCPECHPGEICTAQLTAHRHTFTCSIFLFMLGLDISPFSPQFGHLSTLTHQPTLHYQGEGYHVLLPRHLIPAKCMFSSSCSGCVTGQLNTLSKNAFKTTKIIFNYYVITNFFFIDLGLLIIKC